MFPRACLVVATVRRSFWPGLKVKSYSFEDYFEYYA
jgi:hypothetical protein